MISISHYQCTLTICISSQTETYLVESPNLQYTQFGKQEFRCTDFGSRLLAAEGEGKGTVRVRSVFEVKQYPSGSG
jgi:hypothetical protein